MKHLFKPRNLICVFMVILVLALLLWQNHKILTQMRADALRDGFTVGKEID